MIKAVDISSRIVATSLPEENDESRL